MRFHAFHQVPSAKADIFMRNCCLFELNPICIFNKFIVHRHLSQFRSHMAKNLGLIITSRCSKMSPHTVFSVPHIFYKFNLVNTDTLLIVKHFLWAPLNVRSKQGLTVMDMSKISTQALRAQPAKTSVSPRSLPLGTFRVEERLRLRDRNSILMTQINVYLINPVVMGFKM